MKRIIPISSGKGGVGKTTFAINFSLALSRHGKTVLIDLDTGTSAIRHAVDAPVSKDLYHFFKKDEPLASCVTPLGPRLDPDGNWANWGFVAGPIHMIDDITNFGRGYKSRLIDAINALDAEFVVLDMRAGLDANVIDFLPISNSGILVFTPHLSSATLAASDIVKAILFRKLRLIFGKDSPFYETVEGRLDFFRLTNDLLDRVEDVYDDSISTLDAFAHDLHESLGDHPITHVVQRTLDTFRVNFVLNLFHGVEESYETAIRPFIENLTSNVTDRCSIGNLGWVTRSDAIHQANCARTPAILVPEQSTTRPKDRIAQELEDLRVTAIGLEPPKKRTPPPMRRASDPHDHLSAQLDVLARMFDTRRRDDFRANFDYITQRALFTMRTRTPGEFGDIRVYKPEQMLETLFRQGSLLVERRQNQ
jgi:MinD-like ATPase involved in chromosome partitioning or flagellar assembly